ncbi:hypothetical protein Tco_1296891, partial [Tanacetum coccineum]
MNTSNAPFGSYEDEPDAPLVVRVRQRWGWWRDSRVEEVRLWCECVGGGVGCGGGSS